MVGHLVGIEGTCVRFALMAPFREHRPTGRTLRCQRRNTGPKPVARSIFVGNLGKLFDGYKSAIRRKISQYPTTTYPRRAGQLGASLQSLLAQCNSAGAVKFQMGASFNSRTVGLHPANARATRVASTISACSSIGRASASEAEAMQVRDLSR